MDKGKTQEFTARIAEASRSELTVIVYDVILEDIAEARRICEKDRDEFKHLCLHASRFVSELMSTLDFKYKLASELLSLYIYVNRQLNDAAFSGKAAPLDEAERVMPRLREAFAEVAKQDKTGPLMANTQQIAAGLTYGKGSLNEITLDDTNRGFLA